MGQVKTYRAKSDISISVALGNGKNAHISFLSVTGSGSVFRTDDEELQKALERHYKFGKLFRSEEQPKHSHLKIDNITLKQKLQPNAETESTQTDNQTDKESGEDSESNNEDINEEATDGLRTVTVSCISDAKEYLADNYEISRTGLRSKTAIIKAAAANGIKFEGLE